MLHEILFEIVLLLRHPGQGQAHSQVNIRGLPPIEGQFGCDARQGQDEVILIVDFVGNELLMLLTDGVVPSIKEQHIAFERRLLLMLGHACLKTGMDRFDIPKAMIQANDNGTVGGVVINYHIVFVLSAFVTSGAG